MSASNRTSRTKSSTVRSSAGDTVTLRCKLSPELSGVTREIRWFKGTECVHQQAYEDRETAGCVRMSFGRNVSLKLRDVKVRDSGQYRCEAHGERKEVVTVVDLHVAGFKLVSRSDDFELERFIGDDVTLPCHLSPKMSAAAMEIRWFKGTDCICLYQNGQVKEGKGYEGRVSLFTHKLKKGNVSLMLRRVHASDSGSYKCAVTHGRDKVENDQIDLRVSEFKLVHRSEDVGKPSGTEYGAHRVIADDGGDVILPCYLSPKKNAVAMEIRWFKGADCICLYQNGQVKEGKGYKGRVSLFTHKLKEGNVSLMLRKVQESGDEGQYKCEVMCGDAKVEKSIYLYFPGKGLPRASISRRYSRRKPRDDEHTPGKPGRRWSNPLEVPTM
ncbi:hypothetical protein PHYPO_G00010940 [Pangasianodon hypophthalmus]|uniref:Ig-like domain-containing protein n=1 Tax=Pangasianodon hypophthalmus TaxID=310915 RepID=A0A5N5Q5A2_PANHP|nr:hypothetical protein PHYPO_G00010940 [Pangasianodon hypophthalmus]